ncbi:MAG: radical SAM protein [Planctomycetes bacterium]|nr:radical SAM protein [Planctomycetota bacterium]
MQLVLQLTRDCNLACTYCYQRHARGASMSAETVRRSVDWAIDAGHAQLALTYFGGEPLLARDVIEATWPDLRRHGLARGALVSAKVSTNGTRLDRSFARFARETALFVSLSVDGGPEVQDAGRPFAEGRGAQEHGVDAATRPLPRTSASNGSRATSSAVERALEHLAAERTPFCAYQVITPSNARHLDASVAWLFERGARLFASALAVDQEWTQADFDALQASYAKLAVRYRRWLEAGERFYLAPFDSKLDQHTKLSRFKDGACRAGVRQFAIDPEGFLYPCIEFLESKTFRVGHVETGLDRAALRALWKEHGGTREEACDECGIRSRCASSCACVNLRTSGELRRADAVLCAHERAVTLAADELGAELFAKRERHFLDRQYNPQHGPLEVLEGLFTEVRT